VGGAENIVRAIQEHTLLVETVIGSHDKALQAGQCHGHDQRRCKRECSSRQHEMPGHPLRMYALRERAGVERLGDSAIPRTDPERRSGDDHNSDMTRFC